MDDSNSSSGVSTCLSPIITNHSSINSNCSSMHPDHLSFNTSCSSHIPNDSTNDASRSSIIQNHSKSDTSCSTIHSSQSLIVPSPSTMDLIHSSSSHSSSPSSLEATPSSLEATPSFLEAKPSSLEATPSLLEATPSLLEATPSLLEATPSLLEATPFLEATPSSLEATPSSLEAATPSPTSPSPSSSGAPVSSSTSSGATIVMSPGSTLSDDSTSDHPIICKQKIVKKKVRPPSKLCPFCALHIYYLYGHLRSNHGRHMAVKRAKDLPMNHPLRTFILAKIGAMGVDRYNKLKAELKASAKVVSETVEGDNGQGSEVIKGGVGHEVMDTEATSRSVTDNDHDVGHVMEGRFVDTEATSGRVTDNDYDVGHVMEGRVVDTEATSGRVTDNDYDVGHVVEGQEVNGCVQGQKVASPKVMGISGPISNGDECCNTCTTIFRAWETERSKPARKGNNSTSVRNNMHTKRREVNRQLKVKVTVDLCSRLYRSCKPCKPWRRRKTAAGSGLKKSSRFPQRIRKSTINEAIFDYYTSTASSTPGVGDDSSDLDVPLYSTRDARLTERKARTHSTDIKADTYSAGMKADTHTTDKKPIIGRGHTKRRWSKEENSKLLMLFDHWLLRKQIPPGVQLQHAQETLFQCRTVPQLRSKIHNMITGKAKINWE